MPGMQFNTVEACTLGTLGGFSKMLYQLTNVIMICNLVLNLGTLLTVRLNEG